MKNKEKANNLYYPNELLSSIMHNFNFYQNYYSFLLKQNPALSQENKTIIENYNNFISTLLNEGFDYKVFLQNNTCEDKGAIRDDVLINIMEAIEYKGVIQTTCKTCKFKIKPNLFFIHVPLDKSNSVGFYSIIYSYKSSLKILHKILNGIDKGGFEEEYFCLCANMIYYIVYPTETQEICCNVKILSLRRGFCLTTGPAWVILLYRVLSLFVPFLGRFLHEEGTFRLRPDRACRQSYRSSERPDPGLRH